MNFRDVWEIVTVSRQIIKAIFVVSLLMFVHEAVTRKLLRPTHQRGIAIAFRNLFGEKLLE